jgi:glucose-1-phosphate adenylyltransferase
VGADAEVTNSSVTAGCEIYGIVRNSVLGSGVYVGEGAVVEDSVIMENVRIEAGARVRYSILDAGVTVGENATVGEYKMSASDIAVVGADVKIAQGSVVPAGAMLSEQ